MPTDRESDQRLLDELRRGDPGAFEALFRAHYADLLRFARAQLGSHEEAEDVVHDVFLRVWEGRGAVGGDRSLRTYLLVAVRNRAIDRIRRRTWQSRWLDPEAGVRDGEGIVRALEVAGAGFDSDPASVAELQQAILRALDELPERCRTAFLLCRDQELSYSEAATVMGVATATVKTQVARALASLRHSLAPFLSLLLLSSGPPL